MFWLHYINKSQFIVFTYILCRSVSHKYHLGDLFTELETAVIVSVPLVHAALDGSGQVAEMS